MRLNAYGHLEIFGFLNKATSANPLA